ncbi:CBS domain-containing protein [uncultured Aeromicrobium sp.]|uniref:CBS domain-containing protein n=1 Tax=uncultured Aeromicrobium sp. TaxID=337820 RepID=UPI0025F83941|nr:CBS domain-containing protein [uncultured Aeromicrobium sp.]
MAIRPLLRPGAAVLRRDVHHLQVGTAPGVIVRDEPGSAAVLRHADGVHTTDELAQIAARAGSSRGTALVAELLARGALVVMPLGGRRPRIDLRHDAGGTRFAEVFRALVDESVVFCESPQSLVVTVTVGEPAREAFEVLRDHRIAHLPVVLVDERVRLGPLVFPGHSPCLECFDLQQTTTDPYWPALLTQFGAARPARPGASASAVAFAAAEAARAVDDVRNDQPPRLLARSVLVGQTPSQTVETIVGFQHRCGCHLLAA